jgi:hypothetical protein
MAVLVTAIHALQWLTRGGVDARGKPAQDWGDERGGRYRSRVPMLNSIGGRFTAGAWAPVTRGALGAGALSA